MASLIEKSDTLHLAEIAELFNGKGWHGLGTPTEFFTKEALRKVLFGHEMVEAGIMVAGKFVPTGQRYAVSDDNNLPMGDAVGEKYWTPTNEMLYEIFMGALEGSGYKLVSAITVQGRTQFALDAKGENIKIGKRTMAPYVGLHRAFGGKTKVVIAGHSTVIQCGNTTYLFNREAEKSDDALFFKNTAGLASRVDEIKFAIEQVHGVSGQFARAMKESDSIPLSVDNARLAYAGFVTLGKPVVKESTSDRAASSKTANRIARLVELFKVGKGNNGQSVGDWFNGLTDYYTHESAGGEENAEKQWMASEFGSARNVKANLIADLYPRRDGHTEVNVEYLTNLVEVGARAVKNTDAKLLAATGFWN
jgi:hypothetical protein